MMERVYQHFGLWGAVVVSVIALIAFAAVCVLVLFHEVPAGSRDLANILFGALSTMSANVVSFWTGSSSGSMQKTALLNQTQEKVTP